MAINPRGLEGEAYLIAVLKNIEESIAHMRHYTDMLDATGKESLAHEAMIIDIWAEILEFMVGQMENYDLIDTLDLHPNEEE